MRWPTLAALVIASVAGCSCLEFPPPNPCGTDVPSQTSFRCRRLSAYEIDCGGTGIADRFACKSDVLGDASPLDCAWFRSECVPQNYRFESACSAGDLCCATGLHGASPFESPSSDLARSTVAFTRAAGTGPENSDAYMIDVTADPTLPDTTPSVVCSTGTCGAVASVDTLVREYRQYPIIVIATKAPGRSLWFIFEYDGSGRLCVGGVDDGELAACSVDASSMLPSGCATAGTATLDPAFDVDHVAGRIEADFAWGHASIAY